MFWPTINALIQELAPQTELVHANTLLMAGVQGGCLIAGAVVGFVYNKIGIGGILLIDFVSYSASLLCYFAVRKGRHVVQRPAEMQAAMNHAEGAVARFVHETREGMSYLRENLYVVLLGASSSLLIGAMLAQNVLLPSLAERVLHAGAVGFGWINAGWGVGAFMSCFCVPAALRMFGAKRSIAICMALLAAATLAVPFFGVVWISVALFWLMGATRGIGGVAITTSLMEVVPQYYMGRVQNTFAVGTRGLQVVLGLTVGIVAQRYSLRAGFALIAAAYAIALVTAAWPATAPESQRAAPSRAGADAASMLPDPVVEQVSST
jgi:MFS family permease